MRIVCVFGPTSTGKSDLAVDLALKFDGEVVSADSMQVYQGCDIGTGKITEKEMRGVKHHLLNVCSPHRHFSAGEFQKLADQAIEMISASGKLPILAGGTGLYFKALLKGLAPVGPPDHKLRNRLRERAKKSGICAMHKLLNRLDPETAKRLPENDSQRILRALEFRIATGKKLSDEIAKEPFGTERYETIKIGLQVDRSILKERINSRVDKMVQNGWVDEVKALLDEGVQETAQCLRAIGYREIVSYLKKEVNLDETIKKIKIATHQYAKRQVTWFKKESNVNWLESKPVNEIAGVAAELINRNL